MSKKCAIIICSCDAYQDIWDPFFRLMDKYWQDIPYNVYLNTETVEFNKDYEHFSVKALTLKDKAKKEKITWSQRFIDVLNRISEEYVFLVLDDFFLCNKVDYRYFEEIMNIMDNDNEIASFQFYGTRIRNAKPENYVYDDKLKYDLIWKNGWRTHFVPTVWRKSVLLKWLRPWESIWGFELYGSDRARRWNYKEKVYVVQSPPIYDYLWIKDCSAIINGKWLGENELTDFFASNGIDIDYTTRGLMTYEEYQSKTMTDVIKKYKPHEIVVKVFNRIRSLF